MKQSNLGRMLLVVMLACFLAALTGCGSGYNYSRYRAQAESALESGKLKKAKELYAVIYQQETTSEKVDTGRTTWAFYRLGVIAEVTGDIRLAKGYYWGDRIDEGFYQVNPAVDRLVQIGWQHLDDGKPPRTLEEILALEKGGAQKLPQTHDRKKREVVIDDLRRPVSPLPTSSSDKTHSRTFQRSLTPPPPGSPEPFRVFY